MTRKTPLIECAFVLAAVLAMASINPAMAQGKKMVIAAPGIPPVFASTVLYVAEKEGLFKKYGANVEVRPFDTGTAASRAVISTCTRSPTTSRTKFRPAPPGACATIDRPPSTTTRYSARGNTSATVPGTTGRGVPSSA